MSRAPEFRCGNVRRSTSGASNETGEQLQKTPIYPGSFPDMFPGLGLAVNSPLWTLLRCKVLIYQ